MGQIPRVRLPASSTAAKKPQAQAGYQCKYRPMFSLPGGEFGEDHWLEDLSSLPSMPELFRRAL
jgi:hypothetical protein